MVANMNLKTIFLFYILVGSSQTFGSLFDDLPHNGAGVQEDFNQKDQDKRSISDSNYNLVFQEVVPLNITLTNPPPTRRRKLKKIPLRFQEVVEVSTESPDYKFLDFGKTQNSVRQAQSHDLQEVKEVKRFSLKELEQKFPQIFSTHDKTQDNPLFQEVFEVKKLSTKYLPSQPIPRVNPVYQNKLEREIQANHDVLRDVNLSDRDYNPQRVGDEVKSVIQEGADGRTQIIISVTNNPEIRLHHSGGSSPTPQENKEPAAAPGPPAPPPASLYDSYGVPLSEDTTNRPASGIGTRRSLFSGSRSRNNIVEDTFGSTGYFTYDFDALSVPVKARGQFQDTLELTTPRLSVLTPPSSSYDVPQAPVIKPPEYSIDITQDNAYLAVQEPTNSYQQPQGPPLTYQPPQQPSNSYRAPQEPTNSYQQPQAPPVTYQPPQQPSNSYSAPQEPTNSYHSPIRNSPPKVPQRNPPSPPPSVFPPAPPVTTTVTSTVRPVTIAPTPTVTIIRPTPTSHSTVHHYHSHTHTHNLPTSVSFSVSSQTSSSSSSNGKPFTQTSVNNPNKPSYQWKPSAPLNNPRPVYRPTAQNAPRPSYSPPAQNAPRPSYSPPAQNAPRPKNSPPSSAQNAPRPSYSPPSLDSMTAPKTPQAPLRPPPSPPATGGGTHVHIHIDDQLDLGKVAEILQPKPPGPWQIKQQTYGQWRKEVPSRTPKNLLEKIKQGIKDFL